MPEGGAGMVTRGPYTLAMPDQSLPLLADDAARSVLAVVAHPDDLEYGASAAVARWTAAGADVGYLLLTRGEAGIDAVAPEQTAQVRSAEQIAAGAAVGVSRVDFLAEPDGALEYGLGLRRQIARVIRRHRPEAVLTLSWEVEFIAGLNQADHRVAGLATLDAVRDAGNRWVFPELLEEGLPAHQVRRLLVAAASEPTHAVEVTGEPLERGIASLQAHRQYLEALPDHPTPRDLITGIARAGGQAAGVAEAIPLRVWEL